MIKVSVIVPVYNAHNTLNRCLESLTKQTLEDIEIICVDDCSVDDSWAIMQDWERRYPEKMIIINSPENRGPGGARNIGLQYARGEYIGFCDSDDYVHSNMYKLLYDEAKTDDYDFVDCGYFEEKENNGILRTGDDCIGNLDDDKRKKLIVAGGYLWSHIFKKEILEGISFRENVILEDMETLMQLIIRAKKISIVKEILYMYCYYDTSSSRNIIGQNYHEALMTTLEAIRTRVMSYVDYENIKVAVEYAVAYLITLGVINSYKNINYSKVMFDRCLNELRVKKNEMISVPILDNEYIMAKITDDERKLLINL